VLDATESKLDGVEREPASAGLGTRDNGRVLVDLVIPNAAVDPVHSTIGIERLKTAEAG
jgi:hypothetical protein